MEWLVQEVLDFQCFVTTTHHFLWFYLKAANADDRVEDLAKYLALLSLLDHKHLSFWPSTVAAAVVALACLATNNESSCHLVMEDATGRVCIQVGYLKWTKRSSSCRCSSGLVGTPAAPDASATLKTRIARVPARHKNEENEQGMKWSYENLIGILRDFREATELHVNLGKGLLAPIRCQEIDLDDVLCNSSMILTRQQEVRFLWVGNEEMHGGKCKLIQKGFSDPIALCQRPVSISFNASERNSDNYSYIKSLLRSYS
nr:Hypothetical protein [Oryza sativa Japonica Group]